MRSNRCVALLATLLAMLVGGEVPGQQTWIVDPGGTGHFLDLQTAINASAPGDTVIVRGGVFSSVTIDRSVQVVGDQPRPRITTLTQWPGTNATLSGLEIHWMTLTSCVTSAEDLDCHQFDVDSADAVFVACRFNETWYYWDSSFRFVSGGSHVVFDGCRFRGGTGYVIGSLYCTPVAGSPALRARAGSFVELADSTLRGADPLSFWCLNSPGTNGLQVDPGAVVHLGHSTVTAPGNVAAVSGSGLVVHEATQFTPPWLGGTPGPVPIVTGTGAPPGGTIHVTLRSTPSLPAVLAVSLGQRSPVSLYGGNAWIDPGAFLVLGFGVLDPLGSMNASLPLPPWAPRGLTLTFQGVVGVGAGQPPVATTPTIVHIR